MLIPAEAGLGRGVHGRILAQVAGRVNGNREALQHADARQGRVTGCHTCCDTVSRDRLVFASVAISLREMPAKVQRASLVEPSGADG